MTQNVIKYSTQNVITFLTHNVITQNVIQVGTRSQSTKSEVCSKNVHGMCIQADYWWGWAGATEEGVITEKIRHFGGGWTFSLFW